MVCLVTGVLILTGLGKTPVQAADCKALYEGIRKQRTLMVKKTMIQEAMKSCPSDADILYQNGYIHERLRKYDEAIRYYNKAISIRPGYAKAYFNIGDIQMSLNNYREAIDAYQKGLQYKAGDSRAQASLDEARGKYKELTGKDAPAPPVVKTAAAAKSAVAKEKPSAVAVAPSPVKKDDYAVAPIMRLQVPFYKKTTNLSQDAQDVLGVVVGQAMNRQDMLGESFVVNGHTDNIGDEKANLAVSEKRAKEVHSYLTKNFGIASGRLKLASHGQKSPKVPNSSPANQELNRRVEFTR